MGELDSQDFMTVVRHAPLVSIDLFLRDRDGRVLVGLRRNATAKGLWFVPGGRIRKDERLDDAFSRICESETGIVRNRGDARFMGVYEHFYHGENAEGTPGVGTHYVVLAFELNGVPSTVSLSPTQHSASEWKEAAAVLSDANVHRNTKDMLKDLALCPAPQDRADAFMQYQLVAARRNATNALLWQSPVLSLTAQAFLFTIALNTGLAAIPRTVAAGLAIVVALASMQLLLKHRALENADAKWLEGFEAGQRWRGLERISRKLGRTELHSRAKKGPGSVSWVSAALSHLKSWSAANIWTVVLFLFFAAALYVLISVLSCTAVDDGERGRIGPGRAHEVVAPCSTVCTDGDR
jgi:colanic acid biosynthesis protein WcaH